MSRQIALIEHGKMAPDLRVGNLDARRDLTDVRDVVAAYLRIMDEAVTGTAWNVCSGTANRIGLEPGDRVEHSSFPVAGPKK